MFMRAHPHAHLVVHVFVNVHNGCLVPTSVAVVGGAEDCDDSPLMLPQEAIRHKLVRTDDELKTVDMVEVLRNVLHKESKGSV